MSAVEAAWVAGIYEGEGCLNRKLDRRNDGTTWAIRVTMADHDIIQKLAQVTGVGNISFIPRRIDHHKDQHLWIVTRRVDIAHVLTQIKPHLGLRRGQRAQEFLDWYAHAHVA